MIEVDDFVAAHSTKAEMKFIDGLGTYSNVRMRRSALLAGYLTGAFKRVRWGDIDPITVIRYASASLAASIPHTEGTADGRS